MTLLLGGTLSSELPIFGFTAVGSAFLSGAGLGAFFVAAFLVAGFLIEVFFAVAFEAGCFGLGLVASFVIWRSWSAV